MKCLLVDDEPGIREGLAMLLRRRGFEVTTAGDCAAAAAALDAQNFDVVVTCLLYTSPSPRDVEESRMPSSA